MGNKSRLPLGAISVLTILFILPGCFPLPMTLAMSGISYAASGKSIGDHFLSSYMQRDCSVSRAIFNEATICEDEGDLMIIVEDLDISTASGDVLE